MKARTPARRSRSNDGTPNRVSSVLPIDPGLLRSLLASFTEARKAPAAPRIFHGPKPFGGGHPKVVLTDEQVLAIRKMREWHGMSELQIAKETGLTEGQITSITQWRNRVHLDPGPRPAPSREEA